tara:strand:+ start:417 stop:1802 length:1386 start_codon:yes stop_codon:yes gene_type:complete
MKYLSTRGSKANSFKEILFSGIAEDGGLFVPEKWPSIGINDIDSNISYMDLALKILSPFIGSEISTDNLKKIILDAYQDSFSVNDLVSFKKLNKNEVIVELFNGPTLAFKDFAMQLLIPIFDYFLIQENKKINLIVATSGDTGAAAINAVKKSKNISIYCLFPKDRISNFQRRQMSTVNEHNINLCEIDGTFDDCQKIVKSILNDQEFSKKFSISAVNSINWTRIMIQSVYYYFSFLKLANDGFNKINFSVPTGNFGDVYAGFVAYKMGLPINKLIVATNENDILHRFFNTGEYKINNVSKTSSPSMDIQVASNFERLLFELLGRSGNSTKDKMNDLDKNGAININKEELKIANEIFLSGKTEMDVVNTIINQVFNSSKYLLDPHTAVGLNASRKYNDSSHLNCILATASPIKFSETVERAVDESLTLLKGYDYLFQSKEKYVELNNNINEVKDQISNKNL